MALKSWVTRTIRWLAGPRRIPLWSLLRRRFVRILQRLCRDAYASTYVTSAALQRRYPPGPGKFTTHYSDVVIKPVAAPRESFPTTGPYRLVAIGTLATRYKAHDVLLQAVAIAVQRGLDVQLAIIGDGQHLPEMKQLAQDLGISGRVEFFGAIAVWRCDFRGIGSVAHVRHAVSTGGVAASIGRGDGPRSALRRHHGGRDSRIAATGGNGSRRTMPMRWRQSSWKFFPIAIG